MAEGSDGRRTAGSFIRRHRLLAAAVAIGMAGVAVFVLMFFQPQKLFIDDAVDEAPLAGGAQVNPGAGPEAAGNSENLRIVSQGTFRSLDHETSGRAIIQELSDGSRVLRFEGLRTSNGPDLRVYLSAEGDRSVATDFVDLGKLKGNIGDQNYMVPAGVELSRYTNAVIWCRRFSVGFGVAALR